jgi:hypothetical protein
MTSTIFILLMVVGAGFFLWKSWDSETKTFNWKMGGAAMAGLGAAVYEWFNGLLSGVL